MHIKFVQMMYVFINLIKVSAYLLVSDTDICCTIDHVMQTIDIITYID